MNDHFFTFVSRTLIAEGSYELTFKTEHLSFVAGQYVTITAPQSVGLSVAESTHDFSIASAPQELPLVRIAFRESESTFKKQFLALTPGAVVRARGPKGVFALPRDASQPVVCIAGGIGITPFMSMIRTQDEQAHTLTLYYYNATEARTAYRTELQHLPTVHLVYGPFSPESIPYAQHAPDTQWYLAGPPSFVQEVRVALVSNGIAKQHILVDSFSGYA